VGRRESDGCQDHASDEHRAPTARARGLSRVPCPIVPTRRVLTDEPRRATNRNDNKGRSGRAVRVASSHGHGASRLAATKSRPRQAPAEDRPLFRLSMVPTVWRHHQLCRVWDRAKGTLPVSRVWRRRRIAPIRVGGRATLGRCRPNGPTSRSTQGVDGAPGLKMSLARRPFSESEPTVPGRNGGRLMAPLEARGVREPGIGRGVRLDPAHTSGLEARS